MKSIVLFIRRFILVYKQWKHHRRYVYGLIINIDGSIRCIARKESGKEYVEFVLWELGKHNHAEPYWYRMGDGWELQFKPYSIH